MFPKIVVPPKWAILIGFSIIFTIHFGISLFWKHPFLVNVFSRKIQKRVQFWIPHHLMRLQLSHPLSPSSPIFFPPQIDITVESFPDKILQEIGPKCGQLLTGEKFSKAPPNWLAGIEIPFSHPNFTEICRLRFLDALWTGVNWIT